MYFKQTHPTPPRRGKRPQAAPAFGPLAPLQRPSVPAQPSGGGRMPLLPVFLENPGRAPRYLAYRPPPPPPPAGNEVPGGRLSGGVK